MSNDFLYRATYGLQLLAAGSIVIFFSPKKQHFLLKYLLSTVLILAWSALLGLFYGELIVQVGQMGFWLLFPLAMILLLVICCEYSWKQVLYYLTIIMAVQHIAYDFTILARMLPGPLVLPTDILIYALIYATMYYFMQRVHKQGLNTTVITSDLIPMMTILLVVQFISVIQISGGILMERPLRGDICYRLVDALCCAYVLWTQVSRKQRAHYEAELVGVNQAFLLQKEQYRMRQEIIDSINRKCHDLKHQLEAFHNTTDTGEREAYFNELKRDIQIYDMDLDTGNEALNTLLMDKGLYCYERNIRLNCMANMASFSFMRLEDVYAMFGNALDNAIEAVENLQDPEKKIINLKVTGRNKLLIIQIQNYHDGSLHFEDGLPLTTKKDKLNHGYGVKSIRYIAEKYGGTMTASSKEDIFTLQILLPLREDSPKGRTF